MSKPGRGIYMCLQSFLTSSFATGNGFIHEDKLREALMTMGERFSDEKVDEILQDAPIDDKGYLNYLEFTKILKSGSKDKDDL